jgi:hypothetical protein
MSIINHTFLTMTLTIGLVQTQASHFPFVENKKRERKERLKVSKVALYNIFNE